MSDQIGPDGLTDRQRAALGATRSNLGVSNAAPQPTPQSAPVQVQQPQPTPERERGILGILKGRQAQIDKAAGYASGGKIKACAQGGLIRGPGTPTSDSIAARVQDTGEEIAVSTEERILSKEQDKLLGRIAQMLGFESVDALLESGTGKPVGPTIKGGKRGLSGGGSIYDPTYDALKKIPDQAFPNTMSAIRSSGDAAKASADAGNYGGAIGHVGRGAIGGIVGLGNDVVNSAAYALDPAANALKTFVTGDSSPARSAAQPTATNQQASPSTAAQSFSAPSITDIAAKSPDAQFMTGAKPGDMPTSAQGGFTQGGKSYNVKPIDSTEQQGITRVTAPGTSPLYTNIAPEQAVSGLKNQMIGGDAASVNEGLARYARANATRGEMIDSMISANGGNGVAIMPEAPQPSQGMSIADIQSAMKSAGTKTERAALGQAMNTMLNNQVQTRGQDLNYSTAMAGQGITARGQDLANKSAMFGHETAAQRAAGHDQVLMRGQDLGAESDKVRNSILAEQAKAKTGNYRDNFMTVGGGQEWDEKAGTMRNVPQRLVDLRTLQDVGGKQQAQSQAPADAVAMLRSDPKKYGAAFKEKYGYLPEGM